MSIKYRSEIDGLRAIAVLLVIFNHLSWSLFSGGFVGVDVFFVISGFLITSIIKEEIENKKFSFGNFYKKRIIRLAPAYFLVLASTTVGMFFLAPPNDFQNYIESALYSSLFAANFYMWDNIGGYFSSNAELTPLLHLWSLGIEEQFYIVWPIVLIILTKYLFKFRTYLIILATVFCIAISEYFALSRPIAAYFLLPFRAFELLIGAFLVFIPFKKINNPRNIFFSLIGLSLIFLPAFLFSKNTTFPGFNALLPCLGTAMMIYFCREGFIQKLLSIKPMLFVGRISYPAYLWHWPIIVFLNFYYVEKTLLVGVLALSLTLVLAWLTFNFFEKKFLKYRESKVSVVILKGYAIPLSFIFIFGLMTFQYNGFPSRFDEQLLLKDAALATHTNEIRSACIDGDPKKLSNPEKCKLGIEKKDIDFLLIGDSHANHFAPLFDVFAKDAQLRGYDTTQNSTLFLPNVSRYSSESEQQKLAPSFLERNNELINHINTHKYKYIIIAGSYADSYTASIFKPKDADIGSEEVFLKGVQDSIDLVYKNGAKPILVVGSPKLKEFDQTCPVKKYMYNLSINCNISKEEHNKHFLKWRNSLDKIKSLYPDLIIVDPTKIMCSEKECFSELNGIPLYKDKGHLNNEGATLIGNLYLKKIGNPFL